MTRLSCEESVKIMIQAVQTSETTKSNYGKYALAAGAGAIAGAGARYLLPTKTELSSIFNKEAVDTFVTNTATQARGANRSIVKYAGIGAILAAGLKFLSKIFPSEKTYQKANLEYSKFGALVDAPDYAVEIMWYGE